MAYPMGGLPTLASLIARLEELACIIKELSGDIVGPDGPYRVRYALNPANKKYVVLPNVPDDEHLSAWVVGNVERRLGLTTGFPSI